MRESLQSILPGNDCAIYETLEGGANNVGVDIMGYGEDRGSLAAPQAEFAGFARGQKVVTPSNLNGQPIELLNVDRSPAGTRAVKVQEPVSGEWYWFELRDSGVRIIKSLRNKIPWYMEYDKSDSAKPVPSVNNDSTYNPYKGETIFLPSPLDNLSWSFRESESFRSWNGVISMTVEQASNCNDSPDAICSVNVIVTVKTPVQVAQEVIQKLSESFGWDILKAPICQT